MNVEVVETVVSMTPDDPVSVGKAFKVVWEGPGDRYDDIQLFDPNKGPDGKVVQSKRLTHGDYDNNTVTLPGKGRDLRIAVLERSQPKGASVVADRGDRNARVIGSR